MQAVRDRSQPLVLEELLMCMDLEEGKPAYYLATVNIFSDSLATLESDVALLTPLLAEKGVPQGSLEMVMGGKLGDLSLMCSGFVDTILKRPQKQTTSSIAMRMGRRAMW